MRKPGRILIINGGGCVAFAVSRVSDLPLEALAPLIAESERLGWRFVRRLADGWAAGTNRFDRDGESFFVARMSGAIVGVCGLNADTYVANDTTGRVRRLYVLRAYRGIGIGERLVQTVIAAAAGRFQRLRVKTENPEADRLYRRLGFQVVTGVADCTHMLDFIGTRRST